MRPKWHFILRAVLFAMGIIILLLILVYLASLLVFMLQENGVWFLPVFGSRGWYEFLRSLPWILVALLMMFVGVLEVLVRRYSFAYRQPLLYSAIAIVILMLAGGGLVAGTPFHGRFSRFSEENKLPFAGDFYRSLHAQRLKNVHRGIIAGVAVDGFTMKNRHGEQLHIVVTPQTRFPLGTDLNEGDGVLVFGARNDDTVQAVGVRKLDDADSRAPLPHRPLRFLPTR